MYQQPQPVSIFRIARDPARNSPDPRCEMPADACNPPLDVRERLHCTCRIGLPLRRLIPSGCNRPGPICSSLATPRDRSLSTATKARPHFRPPRRLEWKAGIDGQRTHLVLGFEQIPGRRGSPLRFVECAEPRHPPLDCVGDPTGSDAARHRPAPIAATLTFPGLGVSMAA